MLRLVFGCDATEFWLSMGFEEAEVEVEMEVFCFLDGGSMALWEESGLAMIGEATLIRGAGHSNSRFKATFNPFYKFTFEAVQLCR